MAIRPKNGESDSEDDDESAVVVGAEGERIRAEKEAEVMKTILDPLKPTEKEVESHNRTHSHTGIGVLTTSGRRGETWTTAGP